MNSFNTDEDTGRIIQKYQNHNINILVSLSLPARPLAAMSSR